MRSTVVLALDGAAPLAKIETQRKRRVQSSRRAKRSRGVSGLCATPGTKFMARLESALDVLVLLRARTRRARHLAFELSGSDVPGEGEVKITIGSLRAARRPTCTTSSSLAPMATWCCRALTISTSTPLCSWRATPKGGGRGVCVSTFRSSLARARHPRAHDDRRPRGPRVLHLHGK